MLTPAEPRELVPVESALRAALDLRGRALIAQPALLRAFLDRRCPHAAHDVASVVTAIDAQVPQQLLEAPNDEDLRKIARALEKRLRDHHAMNRYAAAWTVRTWMEALGITAPLTAASQVR